MKIKKESENYDPKTSIIYGRISTQVSKYDKFILVNKPITSAILNGEVEFLPSKSGGIGTLRIKEEEIYCLEREFRSDWNKVVRKLCKILQLEDEETEMVIARQPKAPPIREKKKRPTQWQLMHDKRYWPAEKTLRDFK